MDNQMLSSVDTSITSITSISNQITTVNLAPEQQTTRGPFDGLSPEVWLMIKEFLERSDTFRLSRVNKFLFSLLLFTRAKYEAELDMRYLVKNIPSMLYVALKRGRPLDEIEKIVAGYVVGYAGTGSSLLETHLSQSYEPPLHLAIRMNRVDVVDLLLSSGVRINIRWGGHIVNECPNWAHRWCERGGSKSCKNALDIARESKNSEIEQYLLLHGIEDLGRDEPVQDWMKPYLDESSSVQSDWWPSF
ncbi:hypothetical protein F4801DRAFT_598474 [Xylaria longipes]|nr:hypothetical protein F4801DRAFT_598474 [Xylaria longipes]